MARLLFPPIKAREARAGFAGTHPVGFAPLPGAPGSRAPASLESQTGLDRARGRVTGQSRHTGGPRDAGAGLSRVAGTTVGPAGVGSRTWAARRASGLPPLSTVLAPRAPSFAITRRPTLVARASGCSAATPEPTAGAADPCGRARRAVHEADLYRGNQQRPRGDLARAARRRASGAPDGPRRVAVASIHSRGRGRGRGPKALGRGEGSSASEARRRLPSPAAADAAEGPRRARRSTRGAGAVGVPRPPSKGSSPSLTRGGVFETLLTRTRIPLFQTMGSDPRGLRRRKRRSTPFVPRARPRPAPHPPSLTGPDSGPAGLPRGRSESGMGPSFAAPASPSLLPLPAPGGTSRQPLGL